MRNVHTHRRNILFSGETQYLNMQLVGSLNVTTSLFSHPLAADTTCTYLALKYVLLKLPCTNYGKILEYQALNKKSLA